MHLEKYNVNIKIGDKVPIFRDPKNNKKYEGVARLIRLDDYKDTFYEDYEKLYQNSHTKSSLGKKPDKRQRILNDKHQYIQRYYERGAPDIDTFFNALRSKCSRKHKSFNNMMDVCDNFFDSYKDDPTNIIHNLFNECTHTELIRFVQQIKIKDWSPTLFRLERWLVEFEPQADLERNVLFNTPFRTYRNIRTLVKISPIESSTKVSLSKYTTYNGVSSDNKEDILYVLK
jgi:hypothetical protein